MSIPQAEVKASLSAVKFIVNNDLPVKASIKELRSDSIVFELMASENSFGLSDVLNDVEIIVGGKLAYLSLIHI